MITLLFLFIGIIFLFYLIISVSSIFVIFILPFILISKIYKGKSKFWYEEKKVKRHEF